MPRSPEMQRAVKQARYASYKKLCAEADVQPDYTNWWNHYTELQKSHGPFRRLTRDEHYAFWTEKFSMAEIRDLASSLDFLTREQVAA